MLGLKLNHVSKRGHRDLSAIYLYCDCSCGDGVTCWRTVIHRLLNFMFIDVCVKCVSAILWFDLLGWGHILILIDIELDTDMERSSHRHKRSPTPRRRSRLHHASPEHDEDLHLEGSSHRHKRRHTPRRKRRDEEHYQDSQGYEPYDYQ